MKGKELMMRRTLSEIHLLSSSTFTVRKTADNSPCVVSDVYTPSVCVGQVPP